MASAKVRIFLFPGLPFIEIQCVVSQMDEKLQEVVVRVRSLLGVADVLLKQSQSMRSQTARLLGDIPRLYSGLSIDKFATQDHHIKMDQTRNPASIDFLRTEFETSSMFAKIARETTDVEKGCEMWRMPAKATTLYFIF